MSFMAQTPTTTTTTSEALRAEAGRHDQEAADSFDRCDTDGFVSQWAHGITGQKLRAQADIEDNGGYAAFPALYDLDGNRVPAKLIDGKYGLCWALITPGTDTFTGQFVKAFPKREATMTGKGYREGHELAPARAVIAGSGTGLSGAASCYVRTIRTDDGTGQDPQVRPAAD